MVSHNTFPRNAVWTSTLHILSSPFASQLATPFSAHLTGFQSGILGRDASSCALPMYPCDDDLAQYWGREVECMGER